MVIRVYRVTAAVSTYHALTLFLQALHLHMAGVAQALEWALEQYGVTLMGGDVVRYRGLYCLTYEPTVPA